MGSRKGNKSRSMAHGSRGEDKPATLKDMLSTAQLDALKAAADSLKAEESRKMEEERRRREEERKLEQKRRENDFEYLLNNSDQEWKNYK